MMVMKKTLCQLLPALLVLCSAVDQVMQHDAKSRSKAQFILKVLTMSFPVGKDISHHLCPPNTSWPLSFHHYMVILNLFNKTVEIYDWFKPVKLIRSIFPVVLLCGHIMMLIFGRQKIHRSPITLWSICCCRCVARCFNCSADKQTMSLSLSLSWVIWSRLSKQDCYSLCSRCRLVLSVIFTRTIPLT